MGKTTQTTCGRIARQILEAKHKGPIPEKLVIYAIKLQAGSEERTIKRYVNELQEYGFIKKLSGKKGFYTVDVTPGHRAQDEGKK